MLIFDDNETSPMTSIISSSSSSSPTTVDTDSGTGTEENDNSGRLDSVIRIIIVVAACIVIVFVAAVGVYWCYHSRMSKANEKRTSGVMNEIVGVGIPVSNKNADNLPNDSQKVRQQPQGTPCTIQYGY